MAKWSGLVFVEVVGTVAHALDRLTKLQTVRLDHTAGTARWRLAAVALFKTSLVSPHAKQSQHAWQAIEK